VHGDRVARTLIDQRSETRILMLTDASTIRDRVEGLGAWGRRLPAEAV
jgi:hypothetical protein